MQSESIRKAEDHWEDWVASRSWSDDVISTFVRPGEKEYLYLNAVVDPEDVQGFDGPETRDLRR